MSNYQSVGIAEGCIEPISEEQMVEAWQHLVDTGLCWCLEGWFGRTAMQLIENGIIKKGCTDALHTDSQS